MRSFFDPMSRSLPMWFIHVVMSECESHHALQLRELLMHCLNSSSVTRSFPSLSISWNSFYSSLHATGTTSVVFLSISTEPAPEPVMLGVNTGRDNNSST